MFEFEEIAKKKTVHIELPRDVHLSLRMLLLEYNLSIQSVFTAVAERIVGQERHMIKILDDLREQPRRRQGRHLSEIDAESLFNILEKASPLRKDSVDDDDDDDDDESETGS